MITAPVNFKLATFMSTLASKFATFSVRRALPLAMLMIGVGLNSAHGQAIKAGVPKKAVVPPKPTIGLPTIPSLQVTYSPSTTLVAGQPYSVTWVSRNAEAVDFYCTASGTGYADSQTLGLSGTINGTASAAWVGYPSDCTWVADNSEGVVSVKATLTTQAAPLPPPVPVDNAQFISQVPPPAVLIRGQTYTYSVTMKNTGTTTWSSAGTNPYRLGNSYEYIWGVGRIELASSVPPGALGTFNLTVTVPVTAPLGPNPFQWKMLREGVQWFGEATPNVAITVQAPPPELVDNAQFVSQVAPPSVLIPGQSYSYSITMKNTGTTTWTSGGNAPYRLATVNEFAWGGARIELAGPVQPGAVGTFNVSATVPPTEALGTKTFQWRMVHENVQWFGDTTPGLAVTVQAPALVDNAQFVSQVPPPSVLIPGQSYSYSITMKNIGTTTWTSGGTTPHRLAAVNGLAWGSAVIELAGPVAPGAVGTFNVSATVPPAEVLGTKTFQWRMVRENVQWFGDTTPGVAITVQAPALVDNAQFVSQVPPPSVLIPGQSYSYSITMKNIGTTTWISGGTTPHRLAAVNGLAWGSAVIELAGPVPPGAVGTFNVSATVPPAEALGSKTFQWRMVRENVQWFGDTTPGVAITVQAPALVDNAQFVSQVPPPSVLIPPLCQTTCRVCFLNKLCPDLGCCGGI
ncbi:hypothetical protein [Massilia sp. TSP1-1-2]|uniref:hypothetical protein n=1 Tax=Massilia sp. TSP1-1-2 TaxID=2804649 RepID=UPI003CF9C310